MLRVLFLIVACAITLGKALPEDGGMPQCDKIAKMQCSNDKATIELAFKHPRDCVTSECQFRPKHGYTDHPEKKVEVFLQPSKFTKKILHSFNKYEAKICVLQNQMCYCEDPKTCKCNTKGPSYCRQKYRTEKGLFLVFSTEHKPQPSPIYPYPMKYPIPELPKVDYKPPKYYPPPPPLPQSHHYEFNYPSSIPPPTKSSHVTNPSSSNVKEVYEMPPDNSNGGQSDGASDMINVYSIPSGDRRTFFSDIFQHKQPISKEMAMMTPNFPFSLLGLLKDEGEGDTKKNSLLAYYLFQMLKNHKYNQQQQDFHQPLGPQRYDTNRDTEYKPNQENHHGPKYPKDGSIFDPTILFYMLSSLKNGDQNDKLMQLLPFITMNTKMSYGLKMEWLYVKIPSECSCEKEKSYNFNPLLQYFFMQKIGFPGLSKFPDYHGSKPYNQHFSPSPPLPPQNNDPLPKHPQGSSYWRPSYA